MVAQWGEGVDGDAQVQRRPPSCVEGLEEGRLRLIDEQHLAQPLAVLVDVDLVPIVVEGRRVQPYRLLAEVAVVVAIARRVVEHRQLEAVGLRHPPKQDLEIDVVVPRHGCSLA